MTKDQIRIAVAEECKWQDSTVAGVLQTQPPPNYPESLDACAEFEKALWEDESYTDVWFEYTKQLDIICERYKSCSICATPLQRCEAFLRMKGKWND